jgi:hypothetical protein
MKVKEKIAKKGYSLRCNMGYRNGQQTIVSYSALKNGREVATANSQTALLKKL